MLYHKRTRHHYKLQSVGKKQAPPETHYKTTIFEYKKTMPLFVALLPILNSMQCKEKFPMEVPERCTYRKNKSNKARPVIRNTAMLLVAEKILQLNLTLYTLPMAIIYEYSVLIPKRV